MPTPSPAAALRRAVDGRRAYMVRFSHIVQKVKLLSQQRGAICQRRQGQGG
jgi:hypothetical protein